MTRHPIGAPRPAWWALRAIVAGLAMAGALAACGAAPQGTVTGVLKEVGGPPPGTRGIPGQVTLTSTGGHATTVDANKGGEFKRSMQRQQDCSSLLLSASDGSVAASC